MQRKHYKLNNEIIRSISEINIHINRKNCRQLRLLGVKELERFSRQIKVSSFSKEFIGKLWQLGLIQADCIISSVALDINDGLLGPSDSCATVKTSSLNVLSTFTFVVLGRKSNKNK